MGFDEVFEVGVEVEFLDAGLEGGEQSNGQAETAAGLKDVDSAPDTSDGPGKVCGTAFEEVGPFMGAHQSLGDLEEGGWGDWVAAGLQGAADAEGGGEAGFEVQVTGALLLGVSDQRFQVHGRSGIQMGCCCCAFIL